LMAAAEVRSPLLLLLRLRLLAVILASVGPRRLGAMVVELRRLAPGREQRRACPLGGRDVVRRSVGRLLLGLRGPSLLLLVR
jgi:hypothetical protein